MSINCPFWLNNKLDPRGDKGVRVEYWVDKFKVGVVAVRLCGCEW